MIFLKKSLTVTIANNTAAVVINQKLSITDYVSANTLIKHAAIYLNPVIAFEPYQFKGGLFLLKNKLDIYYKSNLMLNPTLFFVEQIFDKPAIVERDYCCGCGPAVNGDVWLNAELIALSKISSDRLVLITIMLELDTVDGN